MGRRKKEEPIFHRECIAEAAERLFNEKGVAATTMDDIAKDSEYSKATLYVYFKNKEEIVGVLALKSMRLLYERIVAATAKRDNTRGRYQAICKELVSYQEAFPLYVELATGEINMDFDKPDALPIERDIYEVGEQIMQEITAFLRLGIEEKVLQPEIPVLQTGFLFWASLSGIISMAEKKQYYIQKTMGITKEQFLETSFHTLFRSFCVEVINYE